MLQELGITDRLKETLKQIDDSASSEYSRLKARFQQHQILLQTNQDQSNEQIQLAVDSILAVEGLDVRMADVLGKEVSRPASRGLIATFSRWRSGGGSEQSLKSSTKRLRLSFVADSDFLAEVGAISADQPIYKETVKKIINSAGQHLCLRLENFLKESLATANDRLAKVLRQEVQKEFANSREAARSCAEAELHNQVRTALENEHDVPGNRYVHSCLGHFLSALNLRTENLSLSAVLLEKAEAVIVSLMVLSDGT